MVNDVPGQVVEFGCYQGLSSRLLCELFPTRLVYLLDSFQGLPAQGKRDSNQAGTFRSPLDTLQETLRGHVNYHVIAGWLCDTLPVLQLGPFCFAHVDVDQESSTREAIEWVRPRMSPGGVIVCDDYRAQSCKGATAVIDEMLPGMVKHRGHGGYWICQAC